MPGKELNPICIGCGHCKVEDKFLNGGTRRYCHHPLWLRARALGKRWIPAKGRGKTSPVWCPLRGKEDGK